MALLEFISLFSIIEKNSQLNLDEASGKHTNSLSVLSGNSTPTSGEDLESTTTSLNPQSLQLNYTGTETDSLILLEDTMFAPDESTSFITTPSLFGVGPNSTVDNVKESLLTIPNKSQFQDTDGIDGSNGYFHGIDKPGKGQGLQVNGEDLHKSLLLEKTYNRKSEYQHLTDPENPTFFNLGVESPQDPSNPIYDTIHEESLLAPHRDPSNDLDLNGKTPNSWSEAYSDTRHLSQLNKVPGGMTPSAYADINGTKNVSINTPDGAPIPKNLLFMGDKNPTKYKGLQIKEVDLHEHLLQNSYTYTHGLSTTNLKPSTSDGDRFHYQDLDIDIRKNTPKQYINKQTY